jgi:redox-sensitive bicupin YhaK (pirin superfamily)
MSAIATRVSGKVHDLGGFQVRRVLPSMACRSVGPFVFLDHIGPAIFPAGEGIDVRPHPHIGLATVTYLFEGAIGHRDTLGSEQVIRPGDVNWMTAGRGIAHSERTPPLERAAGHRLHGLQFWVGLPQSAEENEAEFHHHPSASLPTWTQNGVELRLMVGTAFGRAAAVKIFSPMFYVDAQMPAGSRVTLDAEHAERAVLVLSGAVSIGGEALVPGELAVLAAGEIVSIEAADASRLVLFGGAPLDGPRHMWWNFVSSSRERIEQAKLDWSEQRFGRIAGETEFIPLPER